MYKKGNGKTNILCPMASIQILFPKQQGRSPNCLISENLDLETKVGIIKYQRKDGNL